MNDRDAGEYGTFAEKYIFYNFHSHQDWLDNIVSDIKKEQESIVIILSGDERTGRSYFMESAAFQANPKFDGKSYCSPDFEGYEKGVDTKKYIDHLGSVDNS